MGKNYWRKLGIRLRHWEYWSSHFIYIPVLPYITYLALRAKAVYFFTAANPGIAYGGFMMESKWKIHTDAPEGFFPPTIPVHPSENVETVLQKLEHNFPFPFIVKPDIGSKGRGVMVVHTAEVFRQYHAACPLPYLVQQKIDYPLEAGIFYVRLPGAKQGFVTGMVQKEFIQVTGDGQSSIRLLLEKNPRYLLQLDILEQLLPGEMLDTVLPAGEQKLVLDIGNHARGALFKDVSERCSEKLVRVIDQVCQAFPGFYFGRLDIRFQSWEQLEEGQSFAIIELNGSGSEPTHMYDPRHSIVGAWREVCRHWKWMHRIARANHAAGVPYLSYKEGKKMFRGNKEVDRMLAAFVLPKQSG